MWPGRKVPILLVESLDRRPLDNVQVARSAPAQSASAPVGICRPEWIIEAVDVATPQAAMISKSFTVAPARRLQRTAGSAWASGCAALQRSSSARVAAMARQRLVITC